MSNELIPINGVWNKIKNIFKKIFSKDIVKNELQKSDIEEETSTLSKDSLSEEFQENNRKEILSQKLLYGELGVEELDEKETNEMIEYFTNDIKKIDNELLRIKQHIIAMKQELKKN